MPCRATNCDKFIAVFCRSKFAFVFFLKSEFGGWCPPENQSSKEFTSSPFPVAVNVSVLISLFIVSTAGSGGLFERGADRDRIIFTFPALVFFPEESEFNH